MNLLACMSELRVLGEAKEKSLDWQIHFPTFLRRNKAWTIKYHL